MYVSTDERNRYPWNLIQELWDLLAGRKTDVNNLTVASSMPMSEDSTFGTTDMFDTVYKALEEVCFKMILLFP